MLEVSFGYIQLGDNTDMQEPGDKKLGPFYFFIFETHV